MTMSTAERAEVNRHNAQKSCGPKSAAGKDRSRFNAVKHGMRARQPILPGEDPQARQARLDAWTAQLEPRDDVEQFLVGRAVNLSWQLERAERARAARLADAAGAANRLADLADEVIALGRRLFWDPVGPLPLYPHLGQQDRQAVRSLLLVRGDRRPQRAGADRQSAREHGDRLRLAVGPLGRTAAAAGDRLELAAAGPAQGDPDAGPAADGRGRGRPGHDDLPGLLGDGPGRPARLRPTWSTSCSPPS